MNRHRLHLIKKMASRCKPPLAAFAVLALLACSDRPAGPDPSNPPRPQLSLGYVITADMILTARPQSPPSGMM